MSAGRWRELSGRELLELAWWRPLPGIVLGGVVLALITSAVVGLVVAAAAWAATLAFNALLVSIQNPVSDGAGGVDERRSADLGRLARVASPLRMCE